MQGNSLFSLLPFLIILLLFVPLFLNGRKQRRQMQQTQAMQQALEAGDVVITTSGLRGLVTDASYEDTIDIEIADGVVTTWLRAAVREKVSTDEEQATSESATTESATAEPATASTATASTATASTGSDAATEAGEKASDASESGSGGGKPIIH